MDCHLCCHYEFQDNDIVWVCKYCRKDKGSVYCNSCFQKSNHEGHDTYCFPAVAGGGCCDCGDINALSSQGFCFNHKISNRFFGNVQAQHSIEKSNNMLSKTGQSILAEFIVSISEEVSTEDLCTVIDVKAEELKAVPVIRFIKFDDLVAFGTFPRYPDHQWITCNIDSIDRDNSLLIFISHCWMRGHREAEGWNGQHHPDNVAGDKFNLCVKGIEKLRKEYAPKMKDCYIWLDYACMDQNNKAKLVDELERYDKVMECCDAMFTPIVDLQHQHWDFPLHFSNMLDAYQAKLWNQGPTAYLNRGWCRIEMLYAANIPLLGNSHQSNVSHQSNLFEAGLAHHCSLDRRPHFLFGNKELADDRMFILPPLQHSYLIDYDPEKGILSQPEDIKHIRALLTELKPYIVRNLMVRKYEGDVNEDNVAHGYGVFQYSSGCMYSGQFENGSPHGDGKMQFVGGDVYEGKWVNASKYGQGIYRYSTGDVYEGEFVHNLMEGKGKMTHADGSWYAGDFVAGKACGCGTFRFVNGDMYEGEFKDGRINGMGICCYTDGGMYDGDWVDDKKSGNGRCYFADGNEYDGEWLNDVMHGKGIIKVFDGPTFEGVFENSVFVKSIVPN